MKVLVALAALGLAAVVGSAAAQHRGQGHSAASSGWHKSEAGHERERKVRRFLPAFVSDFNTPYYWGEYPYPVNHGGLDGPANLHCSDTNVSCTAHTRWERNHSSTVQRAYVIGQPSALVIEIPPHEDSEHDRAWIRRCEPRIGFDSEGVPRYSYNAKSNCASGQWSD